MRDTLLLCPIIITELSFCPYLCGAREHPHLDDRYQNDVVIDDWGEESVALGHRLKGVIGIVEEGA